MSTGVHNINNAVARLSKEHTVIVEFADKFKKAKQENSPTLDKDIKEFVKFLESNLREHFELEELLFFPAAILGSQSYETTLLVLNFEKEHGMLETMLSSLLDELKQTGKIDKELLERFEDFFRQLKLHAKRELIELFPCIDENVKSKALLMRFAQEMITNGNI